MNIRIRILGIVGLTLLILVGLVYVALQLVLTQSFRDLETRHVTGEVQRAADLLSDELTNIESHTVDWAFWDDTWRFAADGNQEYIASNLYPEVLTRMGVDLMAVVRPSGELVWGQAVDSATGEFAALPVGLAARLTADGLLVKHESLDSLPRGLLLLPEGFLLMSSAPVLTSAKTGPARGALIMGRCLDEGAVARIGKTAHASLTVAPFDNPDLAQDFRAARAGLASRSEPFVQPLNDQQVAGYAAIRDIDGKPGLIIRVDKPRDIYAQGQESIRYGLLSLLLVGLACIGVSAVLLERQVLSRLSQLAAEVIVIGETRDPSMRVSCSGNDELARVANAINRMLGELESAEETVRASLEQKESLLKEVHHRVKNNLQIISSLLYLQAASAQSDESVRALTDSQNRIRSMAIVHERLYRSRDLSSIDMAEYVRTVAENLLESYTGGDQKIRLDLDLDDIRLDIDFAVPCGLIINELISNALKHGFPDGREGRVCVALKASGDSRAVLTVADDGVGLPEGFSVGSTDTLGLKLVKTLATQLVGEVEYRTGPGVSVTITFPLKAGRAPVA